ncbi:MAG: DNA polymerase I, partial [Candidatus Zixiibacteriota bacterium]
MSLKGKRLFLIDGSAIFYRAYFAFIRSPLINSKGENTSASFGFANSLLKILREEDPDYFAVVFDTKKPTFRHKMYAEYKSTRAKMPDDLVEQLPRIHQVVEVLNIASYELEGYEADDVVGTIARKAESEGCEVWCVTGDKDYFQLVSDRVKIYNPGKASDSPQRFGRKEVKAKFGVYPELVVDKLALMGDSSDNVPGVRGVGPKTADKLLEQFGSLEGVLNNHEQISAKGIRKKVADNIDLARLSRELVTIDTAVPIKYDLDEMKRCPVNYEAVKKLFLELEFTSQLKQLIPESDSLPDLSESTISGSSYATITSLNELKELVEALSKAREIAIDTETTSLDPLEAELVGVSLTDRANAGWYVPLGHTVDLNANLPFDKALTLLKKLLQNKRVQKIGQNIKYDMKVLHRYGVEIDPVSFDTMLASYVLDPSSRQHSLDFLAMKHFDHKMQPITDLIGRGKSQKTFDTVPVDVATAYAVEDADYTYRLRALQAPLIKDNDLENLYYNIELPLIRVLAAMEEAGVRVDHKFLAKLSGEMDRKLDRLIKNIYKIAGVEFNINSTQQLSHILFE